MRPESRFLRLVAVVLLLVGASPIGAQVVDNPTHTDAPAPIECPTPIKSFVKLVKALGCVEESCNGVACDEIRLESFEEFAYGPQDPATVAHVLRDVAVSASDQVIWNLGDREKSVKVARDVTLTLKDISVEGVLKTAATSFLLPSALSLMPGSKLSLQNVTFLTSASVFDAVQDYAVFNLPSDDFVIEPGFDGVRHLTVSSFISQKVTATNVTITQWMSPDDEDGLPSVEITNSKMMQNMLANFDSRPFENVSELDIVSDLAMDPEDWPLLGITIKRNVFLSGLRARHQSLERVPLLDMKMVSDAVKIAPGAIVEIADLEIINLALGPLDSHYGFLMHFFNFSRNDDELAMIIRDSTLVVSCTEIEHFEFAVAVIGNPFKILVNDFDDLELDPDKWKVTGKEDGMISVEWAHAYGIEFHRVNLTCDQTHGDALKPDFKLSSPLVVQPLSDLGLPEGSKSEEEDGGGSKTFSIAFKVVLGVLSPIVGVLGFLLIWKVCRKKPKAVVVPEKKEIDIEGGDFVKDLGGELGDKAMKHSLTDSFEMKDTLDKLPSHDSHDQLKLAAGHMKMTPSELGASNAREFIPDILAVSEEIDDKQLVMKDLLGQGEYTSVHKGVWRELDVAVKTIVFRGDYDSKNYHQNAIREVAITSGLAHPNVVCTYSYDIKRLQAGSMEARVSGLKNSTGVNILDSCSDWKLFIIQEFCEKGTLHTALRDRAFVDKRTGSPDLESLLEVASGIVKGMNHIHAKNILHGNLKPSNVLLKMSPDTHTKMLAKIADFGLSLKMNLDQTHVSNAQHGTPFYMAREVLEKGSASKAADVYAFGVILWEMYTSQLSPTGTATEEMLEQFPKLPWSCPAPYGVLAIACMHAVPSARPSFSDVMEFLRLIWQQQRLGTLAPPPVVPPRFKASIRDCKDLCLLGCINENNPKNGALLQTDSESEKFLERRRTYFWKSLGGPDLPEIFKKVEYEQVYWPETDDAGDPLAYN